ncbi:MAG: helix-turn-helix domain-containing protein [Halobacteriales archaeon]
MKVEWVRNVAPEGDTEMLFFAEGGDFDAFETALEADPTVSLVDATEMGDQRIYRVGLVDPGGKTATGLYSILTETASLILSATATHEGWCCHFGFPDRSALNRFFEACRDRDIGFEILRMTEERDAEDAPLGLTDPQREALVAAVDCGFFDVPRQCTLEDLGDHLDISDTATSMRLRRGTKTLVERTVHPDDESSSSSR